MLDEDEAVKRRFKTLIASLLRATAEDSRSGQRESLEATVRHSAEAVLVRLHWRKCGSTDGEQISSNAAPCKPELVDYRVYSNTGERDIVIIVTRDAAAANDATTHSCIH